jgi:aspartate/methionine/tyrosine aminotransferase
MGGPISKELELVSFHTVSKGYFGECGQRGGYLEMTNVHPAVSFIEVLTEEETICIATSVLVLKKECISPAGSLWSSSSSGT